MTKIFPAFCAFLVTVGVNGQEMYRWTDQSGKVHYGESVPPAARQRARSIDLAQDSPSEAQRRDANVRLERDKGRLVGSNVKNRDVILPDPAKTPGKTPAAKESDSCEAQWQKYAESVACFNPYRTRRGVRAEGYANCTEVAQPYCLRPPSTPE